MHYIDIYFNNLYIYIFFQFDIFSRISTYCKNMKIKPTFDDVCLIHCILILMPRMSTYKAKIYEEDRGVQD